MKTSVFLANVGMYLICTGAMVCAQMHNEYAVGVDSRGNYGFSVNRSNDNSLLQVSYSSLNMNNTFRLKNFPSQQQIFTSQLNTIGLGYFRKKPLNTQWNLFYGASFNWANSPFRSTVAGSNNSLSNLNLQLGINYKLTENITIGAEIRHSYGNYWMNNLMPSWQTSPLQSSWLSW